MFVYLVPIIVFIISCTLMYLVSNDKEKSKPRIIFIRNVLPSIVISLFVFIIIKYRDSGIFNNEPLMTVNYFD